MTLDPQVPDRLLKNFGSTACLQWLFDVVSLVFWIRYPAGATASILAGSAMLTMAFLTPGIGARKAGTARNECSPFQFSEGFEGSGAELFAAADGMGLEGIVSKRATSSYRSGRSSDWLKTKCFVTSEFLVVGIGQVPNGPAVVLLASIDAGALRFAGAAFIGLAAEERKAFWSRVEQLRAERPALPELRAGRRSGFGPS